MAESWLLLPNQSAARLPAPKCLVGHSTPLLAGTLPLKGLLRYSTALAESRTSRQWASPTTDVPTSLPTYLDRVASAIPKHI